MLDLSTGGRTHLGPDVGSVAAAILSFHTFSEIRVPRENSVLAEPSTSAHPPPLYTSRRRAEQGSLFGICGVGGSGSPNDHALQKGGHSIKQGKGRVLRTVKPKIST